jgi:transcriptional regulator
MKSISKLVAAGTLQRLVAVQFGTSQANVSDIVSRKTWNL